ncbi:MAG: STAS domain-containing protein [Hyphomicrobiales bacterium]|nr:STAS domain-containing protein [Hyphomicrobiales bacterium]
MIFVHGTADERDDHTLVTLAGEIDLEYANHARRLLLDAVERGKPVIVDLSAATMIDSSGVASLVEAFQESRAQNQGFALAGTSPQALRVITLARLETVFPMAADVAAAQALVAAS